MNNDFTNFDQNKLLDIEKSIVTSYFSDKNILDESREQFEYIEKRINEKEKCVFEKYEINDINFKDIILIAYKDNKINIVKWIIKFCFNMGHEWNMKKGHEILSFLCQFEKYSTTDLFTITTKIDNFNKYFQQSIEYFQQSIEYFYDNCECKNQCICYKQCKCPKECENNEKFKCNCKGKCKNKRICICKKTCVCNSQCQDDFLGITNKYHIDRCECKFGINYNYLLEKIISKQQNTEFKDVELKDIELFDWLIDFINTKPKTKIKYTNLFKHICLKIRSSSWFLENFISKYAKFINKIEIDMYTYAFIKICRFASLNVVENFHQKFKENIFFRENNDYAIRKSAKYANMGVYIYLIKCYFNMINQIESENLTEVIEFLCRNGKYDSAKWLYKNIGDNNLNLNGALLKSCKLGHIDQVKWLIGINERNIDEKNLIDAFDLSCVNGHLVIAQYIYNNFHELKYLLKDWTCYTIFRRSCLSGRFEVVQWLIEICGDNLDITGEKYKSDKNESFLWSCERGHLELAQYLYPKCKPDQKLQYNAFLAAIKNNKEDVVMWMYESCDVNFDSVKDQAFKEACVNGHISIAKWIYEKSGKSIYIPKEDIGWFRMSIYDKSHKGDDREKILKWLREIFKY